MTSLFFNPSSFLFDLHIHTNRYSRGCSILEPREMVAQAIKKGLNGIAITEHDHLWSKKKSKI